MMVTTRAPKRKNPYSGTKSPTYKKKRYEPYQTKQPMMGRIEKKVNDLVTATYQVNTTGTITLLACPQLGTDYNNRTGRKINLKSVFIRGFVRTEESSTLSINSIASQMARFIIFIDNQPTPATAVAVTDVLVEALPSSQLNLSNRDRFQIICDKTYTFDPAVLSTVATQSICSLSRQIWPIKKYKYLNVETLFNATNGGTFADITTGALYMLWIGSNAAGAGTDINAVLSTRVRYTDA